MTWRTTSLVLASLLCVQSYRACHHAVPDVAAAPTARDCTAAMTASPHGWDRDREPSPTAADDREPAQAEPFFSINGFRLPAWAAYFAPLPGESMLAYRDRMLPIAQAALAPQRARVAHARADMTALVHLDARQSAELDAAARDAQSQIQDKLLNAFLSGDLDPKTFKPMTGVALARDVLDVIARDNNRFLAALGDDQRAQLAQHPFDFADYLLFSARWEEALGVPATN